MFLFKYPLKCGVRVLFVEKLNNIVIKKSETYNNKGVQENVRENVNGKENVNVNEKVNKMKDIVSKDIKETSTGNRTYRDVCVNGKQDTIKKESKYAISESEMTTIVCTSPTYTALQPFRVDCQK